MFTDIMYIVIFIFCVIGVVQTAKSAAKWLLLPRRGYKKLTLIPFDGSADDAEFILRYEKLFCEGKNSHIIVLDRGMDTETLKICELLQEQGIITQILPPEICGEEISALCRNDEI